MTARPPIICLSVFTHVAITQNATEGFRKEIAQTEKDITQLVARVMEASSPRVIQAYEERIDALEHKKLIAQEKASKTAPAPRSFDEMLELTMLLLSHPQKLWAKGSLKPKNPTKTGLLQPYHLQTKYRN